MGNNEKTPTIKINSLTKKETSSKIEDVKKANIEPIKEEIVAKVETKPEVKPVSNKKKVSKKSSKKAVKKEEVKIDAGGTYILTAPVTDERTKNIFRKGLIVQGTFLLRHSVTKGFKKYM